MCAWRAEGAVRWNRESRIPAESADRDNTLAVLWHAVVRGIDLSQVYAVPGLDYGFEEVKDECARIKCEKSFDILKNKRSALRFDDDLGKTSYQSISLVSIAPQSRRREPLARRTADDRIHFRQIDRVSEVCLLRMIPEIRSVRLDRRSMMIAREDRLEPASPEAE
jgi:hypothetical protein